MKSFSVTREQILDLIEKTLIPLDYVYAMWEGGAAAFDRVDEWSDIDLQVIAHDERGEEVLKAVELALEKLSSIEIKYELPMPTWHGHYQTFFRLRDASPFHMIDFVVIKRTNPNKFLETEIHGSATVIFDKENDIPQEPLKPDDHISTLKARVESQSNIFELFQILTLKELERGNLIEAVSFYTNFTLRPLVEILRIKYQPWRYNFHTRYVYYEFPPQVVSRLESLYLPMDLEDLREKHSQAGDWFKQLVVEMDWDEVEQLLR